MRRRWFILVFCVLLGFGVSLAVPAEDAPETAYDESEALLYEGTPLFSIVVPLASARIAKTKRSCYSSTPLQLSDNELRARQGSNAQSTWVPAFLTILKHPLRC
jgi:hypothetical protein